MDAVYAVHAGIGFLRGNGFTIELAVAVYAERNMEYPNWEMRCLVPSGTPAQL